MSGKVIKILLLLVNLFLLCLIILTWIKSFLDIFSLGYNLSPMYIIMGLSLTISLLATALILISTVIIKGISFHKYDGALVITMNITKDLAIQKQLQQSEDKYRSLYHNAQVGLVTTSMKTSEIIMANAKLASIFGYKSPVELEKMPAQSLWADTKERDNLLNILKEQQRVAGYSFQGLCKDKQVREFELFARYNPELDYIEANIIDITERINFQKKIKHQAHILENIKESILVVNRNSEVLYINQKAKSLLGLTDSLDIHQISLEQMFFDERSLTDIWEKVISDSNWKQEHCFIINGEKKIFLHQVSPLKENQQTDALLIISTDITELVQNREQAESANMAKNQFLANMSHEVRTPMIGILGAVDLLEQSHLSSEQQENIDIVRECGEQLLRIINEILDVSKIEVGQINLNLEPFNLGRLFDRTIDIVGPILREKGLTLELDLDLGDDPPVFVDGIKLRQIIINILFNAIKFTPQGTVRMTANLSPGSESQTWLYVSIADTGIGIPADQMERIFEPFTQVDNSTSREYGGTGLGLYICKKLIDLMHGEIWLESNVTQGTIFYFKMPLKIVEHKFSTEEVSDSGSAGRCEPLEFIPRTVLLVEDNELNQKIVAQMLRNYGFEVSSVTNGLDCLRILQERSFDTILMDMQMPIMDGYEATRLIREDHNLKDIPIIAMTANAMTGDRDKCLACGCTSYISKPFKAEDLVQVIKAHLNIEVPERKPDQQISNLFANDLMAEFFEHLAEMIKQLKHAVNIGNTQQVEDISHDIKGMAGMYGFMNISSTAAQIEQAVKAGNISLLESFIAQLDYQYQQAETRVS